MEYAMEKKDAVSVFSMPIEIINSSAWQKIKLRKISNNSLLNFHFY
jgi:hypothetical protein